jgi:hypothetical protein
MEIKSNKMNSHQITVTCNFLTPSMQCVYLERNIIAVMSHFLAEFSRSINRDKTVFKN